jgi:nucleoside-diphosphate-sugar epimerase
MERPLKAAVTGAGGYLGSRVVAGARARGWQVTSLTGRASAGGDALPFRLGEEPVPDLQGFDALIHCAYDFGLSTWEEIQRVNVLGSKALFEAARAAGVRRVIVVSTMSAFSGCKSLYGRAKLEIEEHARRAEAAVVRPGLIYGRDSGGMVGALNRAVDRLPLLPIVGSNDNLLYLAHEEDLCNLLLSLASGETAPRSGPITAAHHRGLTLREIVRMLGEAKGKTRPVVPLPWQFAWVGLRVLEAVGLRPPFRSDSVISLMNQNPAPSFDETKQTGIPFRPFQAAL